MITAEIMETAGQLAMRGVKVVVQPDGSMIFQPVEDTRTKAAIRQARYRESRASQNVTKRNEGVTECNEVTISSPSPSPSFPPSLLSPNPPILSPTHTPPSAPPPVRRARKAPLPVDDETWLQSLETNKAYVGINIRQELAKCQAWCSVRNLETSRKRFVNWINRAEKPLSVQGIHKPKHQAYNPETATAGLTHEEIHTF